MRISQHRFDRAENRLALHDHSLATPVGQIIGRPMFPRRPLPDVVVSEIDQAAFLRLAEDAFGKRAFRNRGKKAQDIYSQDAAR